MFFDEKLMKYYLLQFKGLKSDYENFTSLKPFFWHVRNIFMKIWMSALHTFFLRSLSIWKLRIIQILSCIEQDTINILSNAQCRNSQLGIKRRCGLECRWHQFTNILISLELFRSKISIMKEDSLFLRVNLLRVITDIDWDLVV